ncbi:MAG: AraC family transcriptional regulator [Stenotrophobium sp.]
MQVSVVRRSIVSVQLLTRFAAGHGVTLATCLRDTGIDKAGLAHAKTEILASQELQLVRNLVREIGHKPGIGLDAGLQYHLSAYGTWGFALITSPSLRSAMSVALNFLDLTYAFVHFHPVLATKHVYQLQLDDRMIPEDVRQFLFERDFSAWANAMREIRPAHLPVIGAEFRFPRPIYAERFREICGIEPRFDAPDNMILFDTALLDDPLPQSDSDMAQLCLNQCRQLLEKRRVRSGIAGHVRDRLLATPSEMPGFDDIARTLNMSPRSLRRRLEQEDTSYRLLLDEVRQMLAEELLSLPGMKLEEIAMRLGYSEPASFIHAYKRWQNISPRTAHAKNR